MRQMERAKARSMRREHATLQKKKKNEKKPCHLASHAAKMRDQGDGRFDAKRARNSSKGKEEEEPTPSHLSCGKRKERGKGAETFDENRARTSSYKRRRRR